jgi:hypothetical protein
MDFICPKCKADTRPDWITPSAEEMEGRDWRCSTCRTTLMLLLGQVTVVHVPPPGRGGGGSALPPGAPGR